MKLYIHDSSKSEKLDIEAF